MENCLQGALSLGTGRNKDRVPDSTDRLSPSVSGGDQPHTRNIQADTPIENVEALFRAYTEFGTYGHL